jgi:hypothetical protein
MARPTPGAMGAAARRLASLAIIASLSAACAADGDASGDPAPPGGSVVVTFEVAGGERFKVLLTDQADIDVAERLVAGDDAPSIPNGRVLRDTPGVNEPWSWSLDPADFEFADVTIEVCDGIPSDVEAGLVTSDRYCPWSAVIADIQPAP